MYPDAPAVDAFDGTEQQRLEGDIRLLQRLGHHRAGREVFGARIDRVYAIRGQLVVRDDGVCHADQVIESLFYLRDRSGGGRRQDRAGLIAQLDQQIDFGAAVLGISQQRHHIALTASKGPGDLADRFYHFGLVEFAAAHTVVTQIDIVNVNGFGLGNHLNAEVAADEALGRIQIENEGHQGIPEAERRRR